MFYLYILSIEEKQLCASRVSHSATNFESLDFFPNSTNAQIMM